MPSMQDAVDTARRTADYMGLSNCLMVVGGVDGVPMDKVGECLSGIVGGADSVAIVGDWSRGMAAGIDTYGMILNFGEDRFRRMRHKKMDDGFYVVVLGQRLR